MRTTQAMTATAVALAGLVAFAGSAQAGTSGPGGATSVGGAVSLTWTWAGPGSIKDIDMQVLDTRCDAQGSYAQMVFERRPGLGPRFGEVRWNKIGCNGAQPHNNLEFSDGFDIVGFYVRSCTDTNSNGKVDDGDSCGRSGLVDNPRS